MQHGLTIQIPELRWIEDMRKRLALLSADMIGKTMSVIEVHKEAEYHVYMRLTERPTPEVQSAIRTVAKAYAKEHAPLHRLQRVEVYPKKAYIRMVVFRKPEKNKR